MKNLDPKILALALTALASSPAFASPNAHIAVANRAGGTITLAGLEARGGGRTFQPDSTYGRSTFGFEIEPMYISQVAAPGGESLVAVGDRKNNQVLFLASKGGPLFLRVEVGAGVFHQSSRGNALFVATDVQKGFNLIELVQGVPGGTAYSNRRFELPARFASGKPHDIVGSANFVYLTVQGVEENGKKADYVLQVSRATLEVVKARKFSLDVHLLDLGASFAIVEQETGLIRIVGAESFTDRSVTRGPVGAHGVATGYAMLNGRNAKLLYVADIDAAPGTTSVLAYQILGNGSLRLIAKGSTEFATAHNLAVSEGALFVTHSGAQSSKVSVLELDAAHGLLKNIGSFETGLNPFGIAGLRF